MGPDIDAVLWWAVPAGMVGLGLLLSSGPRRARWTGGGIRRKFHWGTPRQRFGRWLVIAGMLAVIGTSGYRFWPHARPLLEQGLAEITKKSAAPE